MSLSGNAFSTISDKERTQGVVTLLRVSLFPLMAFPVRPSIHAGAT